MYGMTRTLCLTVFSWTTHNDIGISVPVDIAHTDVWLPNVSSGVTA